MALKSTLKNSLSSIANDRWPWLILRPLRRANNALGSLLEYMDRQRACGARTDLKSTLLAETFSDLTVRSGAFEGMKYPSADATGSALLPKLVGSYESELTGFFDLMRDRDYTDIVDVGCAEGYYAIGLARLFPHAKVYAFDVDAGARDMCRLMARANGVEDRLELGGFCDPDHLKAMALGAQALVVADCEGYEAELFDPSVAEALAPHDVLIECHDYKMPGLSDRLSSDFAATHEVHVATSVPDFEKAHRLHTPELDAYGYETRKFMVTEARGYPQVWLFMASKMPRAAA